MSNGWFDWDLFKWHIGIPVGLVVAKYLAKWDLEAQRDAEDPGWREREPPMSREEAYRRIKPLMDRPQRWPQECAWCGKETMECVAPPDGYFPNPEGWGRWFCLECCDMGDRDCGVPGRTRAILAVKG